jgi:hypothetical protein
MVLVFDKPSNNISILQTKFSDRERHKARRIGLEAVPLVVSLPNADKYRGLTRRPSQEQKGLDERTLMASQQPFHPW